MSMKVLGVSRDQVTIDVADLAAYLFEGLRAPFVSDGTAHRRAWPTHSFHLLGGCVLRRRDLAIKEHDWTWLWLFYPQRRQAEAKKAGSGRKSKDGAARPVRLVRLGSGRGGSASGAARGRPPPRRRREEATRRHANASSTVCPHYGM